MARHWYRDPKVEGSLDCVPTPKQLKAAKALTKSLVTLRKAVDTYFDALGGLEIPEALFTVRLNDEVTHFFTYTPEYVGDLDESFLKTCAQDLLCGSSYPWGEFPGDTVYETHEVNLFGVGQDSVRTGFCPECLKAALEQYPDLEVLLPLKEYLK